MPAPTRAEIAKLHKQNRAAWRAWQDLDENDPLVLVPAEAAYEQVHAAMTEARRLYPWAFPPAR